MGHSPVVGCRFPLASHDDISHLGDARGSISMSGIRNFVPVATCSQVLQRSSDIVVVPDEHLWKTVARTNINWLTAVCTRCISRAKSPCSTRTHFCKALKRVAAAEVWNVSQILDLSPGVSAPQLCPEDEPERPTLPFDYFGSRLPLVASRKCAKQLLLFLQRGRLSVFSVSCACCCSAKSANAAPAGCTGRLFRMSGCSVWHPPLFSFGYFGS